MGVVRKGCRSVLNRPRTVRLKSGVTTDVPPSSPVEQKIDNWGGTTDRSPINRRLQKT